ncbi:MAG: DUF1343 domain-containing protein [Acidobacteriota bacterium]|nr:DUF1343 domain-containing protein [Pyrinomonadaceae bacterium]MDW8305090.1 DUF1343 domain-containing protein [Acidobacteriota bacterium]
MKKIRLGIERVFNEEKKVLRGSRVGIICNQASVDSNYRYSADLFYFDDEIDLRAVFSPQHGFYSDVQDNMIESAHGRFRDLPLFSLYSETREPTDEMLADIDVLVFDLQDVGCRVYTFIYTMANAMKACARLGKRFVVLDRPNPIGGVAVEGNLLEPGHESFVGMYEIPMRHGMTVGELALLFNQHIGCELYVVKLEGWQRDSFYDELGIGWVMPSPNMPSIDTAIVYPGTVFFEGTKVSEGRGTTRPFEIVGAPYIDAELLANEINKEGLDGVYFRPIWFIPTFQKHANKVCGGVFLHVTDRKVFRPVLTGVALLKKIRELYGEKFQWQDPPYEYVFDRNPFDVIAGTFRLREAIETEASISEIASLWKVDELKFIEFRKEYLIY